MRLFHRDFGGEGRPIVILHGLFGSSRNWTTVARTLTAHGHVFALDARNHGESPHAPTHTLSDMQADLGEWLAALNLHQAVLIGHSMGGLTAAGFALHDSSRLSGLIIVDIAPRVYAPRHDAEFRSLKVDVSHLNNRSEVDREMARHLSDAMVRQFLQMNLERTDVGYRWKLNVPALESARFLEEDNFRGKCMLPALFVTGGASDFFLESDHALVRERFPAAEIVTIPGADHYLHYTAQDRFLEIVRGWLGRLPPSAGT